MDAASGLDGVCCSPPVQAQCPRGRVCVTQQQCTEQGNVITDGAGSLDVRILDVSASSSLLYFDFVDGLIRRDKYTW